MSFTVVNIKGCVQNIHEQASRRRLVTPYYRQVLKKMRYLPPDFTFQHYPKSETSSRHANTADSCSPLARPLFLSSSLEPLTLATWRGLLCSAPPCRRNPHGAPPDREITTCSSVTMTHFSGSLYLYSFCVLKPLSFSLFQSFSLSVLPSLCQPQSSHAMLGQYLASLSQSFPLGSSSVWPQCTVLNAGLSTVTLTDWPTSRFSAWLSQPV